MPVSLTDNEEDDEAYNDVYIVRPPTPLTPMATPELEARVREILAHHPSVLRVEPPPPPRCRSFAACFVGVSLLALATTMFIALIVALTHDWQHELGIDRAVTHMAALEGACARIDSHLVALMTLTADVKTQLQHAEDQMSTLLSLIPSLI